MFFIVISFAIAILLAANTDRQRAEELSQIENYELIHFNMDRFESHQQLEFDLFDHHYKVQLVANDNMIPSQIHSTIGGQPVDDRDSTDDPNTSKWFSSLTVSCHYFGAVLEPQQSDNSSYLSLSLCPNRGIRGSITTAEHEISIMPSAYYLDAQYDRNHFHELTDQHLVYTSPVSSPDDIDIASPDDITVSSRHLLRSSDRNKVEIYVMADPAMTLKFKDDYGSSYYQYLKAHVSDVVNGATAKYQAKNWGNAGSIQLDLVYLEVVTNYNGIYLSLYPHFPDMTIGDWTNCKDWTNYEDMWNDGCYITGNADGVHKPKSMIAKFTSWVSQNRANDNYDVHLLLVGNRMTGIAGVAYRGGMCHKGWNIAVVGGKQNPLERETKTVCHELGHTFGMTHNVQCSQCIMGAWSSWYDWGFESQAVTELNKRFTERSKLDCLRNGVRSFNYVVDSSSSSGGSSYSTGTGSGSNSGGSSSSGECLEVKNINWFMNGEWNADGTVNGRTAYKKSGSSYWIYTALDDGDKVWTMYREKNALYVNSNYYCYKTFISSCTGNWYLSGTKIRNSRFGSCGAFTMDETPQCLKDNRYGESLSVYNNGSLWDDEEHKYFEVVSDECFNDKPIYRHMMSDNVSYYMYYHEYNESADSVDVSKQWRITYDGVTSSVAAECDESDLLQCVEGKWNVLRSNNDSMEMVVDESMYVEWRVNASNSSMYSVSVLLIVLSVLAIVIVLFLFGFFMYRGLKGLQMKKTVEFTQKSVVEDESEVEEQEVEVQVEETHLVETTS